MLIDIPTAEPREDRTASMKRFLEFSILACEYFTVEELDRASDTLKLAFKSPWAAQRCADAERETADLGRCAKPADVILHGEA